MNATRHWIIGVSFAAALGVLVQPAQAEDFPSHPVRIITDSAPGSAIDVPVRIIAEGLSRIWGQQAVVISQPGAGGAIAARAAATALSTSTASASATSAQTVSVEGSIEGIARPEWGRVHSPPI